MKTVRDRLPYALLLFVILIGLISAHAQITPTGDAYTNTALPGNNFGSAITLGVVSPTQTTFIAFDLSSIPAGYTGSNIAKATLKLYVSSVTTAGSFNVDLVNGSWTEATLTANNTPALGSTIAASVPLTKSQVHDYILIDITQALQDWLSGTPNDGIALVPNSPLSATFDSKENTGQSHPPELEVVFNGAITGINTATGSGLTGGGNSGSLSLSLLTSCSSGQILAWTGSAWACKTVGGTGTVTKVGLMAPASDFVVSGSPITASGTLNIAWTVPPDSNNTANAIVKRDSTGSFLSNNITASGQITVNNGSSLNPIISQASAPNAAAIVGFSKGTGLTDGVFGATLSSGRGSSGVIGFDQNSNGSAGSYTAGLTGVTQNSFGVGVLGYGVLSGNAQADIGQNRAGVWGDDSTGVGVVATSDTGSAARAENTSSTFATLVAQNHSTANALVAISASTASPTLLAQNNTTDASGSGFMFRAEAPNINVNGITAACQINTRGDLGCSGDVVQTRSGNGLVKALLSFDPAQQFPNQIVRCYNSLLPEPSASTPPCGFSYTHADTGVNDFNIGFPLGDRFIQGTVVFVLGGDTNFVGLNVEPSGNFVRVDTFYTNGSTTDTPFYLTIF